jgi:hypothetical protein
MPSIVRRRGAGKHARRSNGGGAPSPGPVSSALLTALRSEGVCIIRPVLAGGGVHRRSNEFERGESKERAMGGAGVARARTFAPVRAPPPGLMRHDGPGAKCISSRTDAALSSIGPLDPHTHDPPHTLRPPPSYDHPLIHYEVHHHLRCRRRPRCVRRPRRCGAHAGPRRVRACGDLPAC